MKLGAHCVLYGAETGANPDSVIGRLAAVGAEGCELGERFFSVEDRDKLTAVLDKHNMRLAGMHCNNLSLTELLECPEKSRAALEKVAAFVAPLPDKNIIATGMAGTLDTLRTRTLAQGAEPAVLHDAAKVKIIAENLDAIAKDIKQMYGVTVNYHNHSWEFCDGGLIWYALAEYAPNVLFALDTGWAAASGFDPVMLLEQYPKRFHYVHLRDYIKKSNIDAMCFEEVHGGFVALGTGDMNYPRLMRKLNEVLDQDDWAIVEYELGNFDQNSYLSALSYLRGVRDML